MERFIAVLVVALFYLVVAWAIGEVGGQSPGEVGLVFAAIALAMHVVRKTGNP